MEAPVKALGDLLRRHRGSNSGPPSGGTARSARVHATKAGVQLLRLRILWVWARRRHPDLQGAGDVRSAGDVVAL